jgi:hypothetical protein
MFGRKQKKQEDSVTMNPDFEQDDPNYNTDIINRAFGQEINQINNIPMQSQNMNQSLNNYQNSMANQNVQPQVRQMVQQAFPQPYQQQFQPQARIVKSEMTESGEYVYVVVTNYPKQIGDCQLI